jgi:hypothetical protein
MAITGGFGVTMDLKRGTTRRWVMGRDGVKRWADSGEPVQVSAPIETSDVLRPNTGLQLQEKNIG